MEIQLSDLVEKMVGKEEIACNEQFLLFLQCFQKLSVVNESERVLLRMTTPSSMAASRLKYNT